MARSQKLAAVTIIAWIVIVSLVVGVLDIYTTPVPPLPLPKPPSLPLAEVQFKTKQAEKGMTPRRWEMLEDALACYDAPGKVLVVTTTRNGRHSKKSRHYYGNAMDFRTRGMSSREQYRLGLCLELHGYRTILKQNPPHLHAEVREK